MSSLAAAVSGGAASCRLFYAAVRNSEGNYALITYTECCVQSYHVLLIIKLKLSTWVSEFGRLVRLLLCLDDLLLRGVVVVVDQGVAVVVEGAQQRGVPTWHVRTGHFYQSCV